MSLSELPEVVTCEGFRIPVPSAQALCIDRIEQGKFGVFVEQPSGELVGVASLDSFRDALVARKALAMLVTVLFPSLDHPSFGDDAGECA